jgi:hypothetical protein
MSEIRVDTISEKTSANGVAVDGVTLKDGAVTSTAASTITVADNSDNLTLTSTDADANSGPNLRLYRNSSSPADSDVLGQIDFEGRNDNSQDFVATQIKVNVGDVSDGTEDAQIEFDVMTGGTLREYLRMASGSEPSVVINEDGQDINFRVESDNNANMLFIDGGNDHVNIGTSTDHGGKFNIETTDNTFNLTLVSTDADANSGPNMKLYRNSGSPADSDIMGNVYFTGRNDNSQDVAYAQIETLATDVSDGAEDGYMNIYVAHAGTEQRSRIEMDSTETVFNEGSADIDFRVESNGNANMLFVDAGNDRIGIGTNSPSQTFSVAGNMDISATSRLYLDGGGDTFIEEVSGNTIAITTNNTERMRFFSGGNISIGSTSDPAKLTVRTSDSTAGPNSDADELFLESNGNAGMTIGSSTSTSGNIHFADNGAANRGIFSYDHSADSMKFGTAGAIKARFTSGGALSLNDSSPDVTDSGLCLNQGANDLNILTFKSSDIAHGMTSLAETDTYATVEKTGGDDGGFFIETFSEGITNMMFMACSTSEQSTRSTSATGPVEIRGKLKSGTNAGAMGSDANILIVRNHGTTRFIFDSDGDFHADSSSTTFDEYDDAQLARTFDISHGRGVIESKFDKFISYNHEKLAQLKLVGREEDGTPNHFINVSGMQRLHNGAIWQQYEKHQKLASAFYKLAKKTIGKEEADKLLTEEEIQLLN